MNASPSVVTELPQGWAPTQVSQPPIAGGSGASFTQWRAVRGADTPDVLLLGCVSTPIPGWVEDMRPFAQARTLSVMAASSRRIVGAQVESREEADHLALRVVGAPENAPRVGTARTFIGWSATDVVTCFAVCAHPTGELESTSSACHAAVLAARLDGSAAPPASGVVLGTLTWAVHHPRASLWSCATLTVIVIVVSLASRRRPRSRI